MVGLLIYSFTGFISISATYPLVDKYLVKPIEEMLAAEKAQETGEEDALQEEEIVEPPAIPEAENTNFPPRDTNLW